MGSIYPGLFRRICLVSLLAGVALSTATLNASNATTSSDATMNITASNANRDAITTSTATSGKRGLVFTPNNKTSIDDNIWIEDGSPLTWYSNYGWQPNKDYTRKAKHLEFVPTFWGPPGTKPGINIFYQTMVTLMDNQDHPELSINISHVMTFNEPEMPYTVGGSQTAPRDAALAWISNITPLQKEFGIKAGLPATATASGGMKWLDQFLHNCTNFMFQDGTTAVCNFDFVSIHHYGSFEDLASTIGEYSAK